MAVQAGRVLAARDTGHAPRIVVVNEALAKQYVSARRTSCAAWRGR
jgi:hypothetical protein